MSLKKLCVGSTASFYNQQSLNRLKLTVFITDEMIWRKYTAKNNTYHMNILKRIDTTLF